MGTRVPYEVFRALPKTDLHVHLDGSLRLETILDIAKKTASNSPRRTSRAYDKPSAAGTSSARSSSISAVSTSPCA